MSRRQHRFNSHSSRRPSRGYEEQSLDAWNWETASAPTTTPLATHIVVYEAVPRVPVVSVILQSFLYTYDEVIDPRLRGHCTERTALYIRSLCVRRLETSLTDDFHNDPAHLFTLADTMPAWHITLAWTAAAASMAVNRPHRQIVWTYVPNPNVADTEQVAVTRAADRDGVVSFDTYALNRRNQEVYRDHDDLGPLTAAECQDFGVISTDEEQL